MTLYSLYYKFKKTRDYRDWEIIYGKDSKGPDSKSFCTSQTFILGIFLETIKTISFIINFTIKTEIVFKINIKK